MKMSRREILRWALLMSSMGLAGVLPKELVAMIKPGMRTIRGDVRINGTSAEPGLIIQPGDRISTGHASEAVMVIDSNAYLLRSEGEIIFPEANPVERVLTIISGRLISVFGFEQLTINTPLATIGIRGTGIYLEVKPEVNYVCLCYGRAELKSKLNSNFTQELDTFHHDAPRNFYVNPDEHGGLFIEPAEMINHKDEELILLESLVQRIPLFGPVPLKMPDKN